MPFCASGWREVFYGNSDFIVVKITESFPDIGKQYYCRYSSKKWSEWHIVNSTVATS